MNISPRAAAVLAACYIACLIVAWAMIFVMAARKPNPPTLEQRITALEQQVSELRAASRANVLRALPEQPSEKLTITIP